MHKYADIESLRTLASLCKAEFATNETVLTVTEALTGMVDVNVAQGRALTAIAYHVGIPDYSLKAAMEWDPSRTSMRQLWANDNNLQIFPRVDMAKVTDMRQAFAGCTNLTEFSGGNDTSHVADFSLAFSGCTHLAAMDNLDLTGAETVNRMFMECASLRIVNPGDAVYLDHDGETDMRTVCLDLGNAHDLGGMFQYCSGMENAEIVLPSWPGNNQDVTAEGCYRQDLSMMFMRCSTLRNVVFLYNDQESHPGAIRDCYRMFMGCSALRMVDMLDMQGVNSCAQMFAECRSLRFLLLKNLGALYLDESVMFPADTTQFLYDFGDLARWGDDSLGDSGMVSGVSCEDSLHLSLGTYLHVWEYQGSIEAVIKLSTFTKGLLVPEEIAEITEKGYTIA